MSTIWFISDTHFSHASMIHKFKLPDGSPARKFASVEEMDETMIERWNKVVRPADHVWHLGDVTMRWQVLDLIMPRLKGHKRLIPGNHDIFPTKRYLKYFEKIYGVRVIDKLVFTHIPIAPWSHSRFAANVHGHVHESQAKVMRFEQQTYADFDRVEFKTRTYVNLSVEAINYTPVSLEEIKSWL